MARRVSKREDYCKDLVDLTRLREALGLDERDSGKFEQFLLSELIGNLSFKDKDAAERTKGFFARLVDEFGDFKCSCGGTWKNHQDNCTAKETIKNAINQ